MLFRSIRSPIIVFCSKGDNITPPPQALGWITDLYEDDEQVRAHGQTIVYAVHESIGHLGIFVSGSVARKEHQEFTSNIDMIDVLPPGLYQAEIADKTKDTPNADLASGNYVMSFARRHIDDVRAIVQPEPEDDKRFAAVARASEINLGLYRSLVQPWVRAMVTPELARTLQRLHPLRLTYEMISDNNPLVAPIKQVAERIRERRQPVATDNPLAMAEKQASATLESILDNWRVLRDDAQEQLFMSLYGSPIVQDLTGLGAHDNQDPRERPGVSPEHRRFMAQRSATLRDSIGTGGVREAAIRMLLSVTSAVGEVDERSYAVIRRMRAEKDDLLGLQTFKDIVRDQALVMTLDPEAAIAALPDMLADAPAADIRRAARDIEEVLAAAGPLPAGAESKLDEMKAIFAEAAKRADKPANARRATPTKRGALGTAQAARKPPIAKPDAQLVADPQAALSHGANEGGVSAITPTVKGSVETALPVGRSARTGKPVQPVQPAQPARSSTKRATRSQPRKK